MSRAISHSEAGSILVMTLWIVTILAFLALTLVSRQRLGTRHEQWAQTALECQELMFTGSRLAMERLRASQEAEVASYAQPWGQRVSYSSTFLADAGGTVPAFKRPFSLTIVAQDETGKINVNKASLGVLTEVLKETGAGINAANVAAAIVDWRDSDDVGMYEADLYSREEPPYQPSNADLERIEELLFVEGVTPLIFFGEDANHNGSLDANEDDGDLSVPLDEADGRLQPGLVDLLTVHGEGEINVNTAPEAVLRILLDAAHLEPGAADLMARDVVARRRGADEIDGTSDDRPFSTVAEMAEVIPIDVLPTLAFSGVELGLSSTAFRFYVRVEMPDSGIEQECDFLVLEDMNGLEVVEWHDTLL